METTELLRIRQGLTNALIKAPENQILKDMAMLLTFIEEQNKELAHFKDATTARVLETSVESLLRYERDCLKDEVERLKALSDQFIHRLIEVTAPGSIGAFAARDMAVERAKKAEAEVDRLRAQWWPGAWRGQCGHLWDNRKGPDDLCPVCAEINEIDRLFQDAFPDWQTVTPPEGVPLRVFLLRRERARRIGQPCEICWTNSWVPVPINDPDAQMLKDGTGYVRCDYCWLRKQYEAERTVVKSSVEAIQMLQEAVEAIQMLQEALAARDGIL